jgi:2-keto-4-pentenoate hydratase/2-oxohepta-3-ene-1,7-dioic acid hydratase in catechol pathway
LKLLRVGPRKAERPAVLDSAGVARDVSSIVNDFTPETIGPDLLAKLKAADLSKLPALSAGERIGSPISRTGHFICIGLNYADHAAETGAAIPSEPIIFSKAPSALQGPNDDVMLPKGSVKSDWEVELAVVIGKTAEYVTEAEALSHVFGYAICNDMSEREYQIERGGQWIKGKSAPTFGPLGPWLVTPDEVKDVQNLSMELDLNGQPAQRGSTKTMIFGVAHLISYTSQFMRLEPGDVITTGTPPGVGMGRKPPLYLKAGDTMRLSIAGLGEQRQKVVAHHKA